MAIEQGRDFSLRDAATPGDSPSSSTIWPLPNASSTDERVNLHKYTRTILYYKYYVLAVLAAVIISVEVYSYKQPAKFKATTTLLRQESEDMGGLKARALGLGGGSGSSFSSDAVARMFLQRPVLEAVVKRFQGLTLENIVTLFGDGPPDPSVSERDIEFLKAMKISDIEAALSVVIDNSGQLIHVEARCTNRIAPAVLANAASEAFRKRMSELRKETSRFDAEQIESLLKEKKAELGQVEAQILAERERLNKELSAEAKDGAVDALASEVIAQVEILKRKQVEFESSTLQHMATVNEIDGLKARLAREPEEIILESRYDSPLKAKLVDLRIQLQTLTTQFTPEYPRIRAIQREIESTEAMLVKAGRGEVGGEVRGPNPTRIAIEQQIASREATLSGLVGRISDLRASIEQTNETLKTLPSKVLDLERLKARVQVLGRILLNLEQELENAKIAQISKISNLTVVETALVPLAPYSPDRLQLLLLGLLAGAVLGIAMAFLLEALDDTIKTSEDVTRVLRVVPLGIVPEWKAKEDVLINPDNPKSGISEIFGVLRNNIRHASAEHPEKRLLIASALQGEGKSMIATNLAISYAMEGNKTFLIDMDLRKAGRHRLLDVVGIESAPAVGLSEYLEDKAKLQEIICQTSMEGLFYISSGNRVRNPARLLRSRRLVELLELLEKKLDVVVIDAPAVLPVVDTSMVAVHARGVVMVVQAENTPAPVAKQGIERLRHINAPVLGCVLNQASSLSLKHFHYYGTGTYYYQEGRSDSKA